MLPDPEHLQPDPVGELHLLHDLPQPPPGIHPPGRGIGVQLGEGVDPEFHRSARPRIRTEIPFITSEVLDRLS
jgi:hypothetical protein